MEERMERTIRKIVEPIGLRLRLVSCSASVSGRDVRGLSVSELARANPPIAERLNAVHGRNLKMK